MAKKKEKEEVKKTPFQQIKEIVSNVPTETDRENLLNDIENWAAEELQELEDQRDSDADEEDEG